VPLGAVEFLEQMGLESVMAGLTGDLDDRRP